MKTVQRFLHSLKLCYIQNTTSNHTIFTSKTITKYHLTPHHPNQNSSRNKKKPRSHGRHAGLADAEEWRAALPGIHYAYRVLFCEHSRTKGPQVQSVVVVVVVLSPLYSCTPRVMNRIVLLLAASVFKRL